MARKYKRLSYEDRKTIEEMCRNGKKADEIAAAMDVHRATIYHELRGVFTIVEEKAGKGSTAGWGKLKSGAGWVSLDYCTKLV